MSESNKKYLFRICFILLGILCSLNLYAQNYKDPMTGVINRVYVQYRDSIVESFYYRGDKKIKPKPDLMYSWYAAQDIKQTRGAFEGKLLHGSCTMFYYNKDLLAKGNFKYGVRQGVWQKWYLGGERKSKEKWSKGMLVGTAYYYYPTGTVKRKRKYSGKKGNSIAIHYTEEGLISAKEEYKGGRLIKKISYEVNAKGKSVEVKPAKPIKKKKGAGENEEPKVPKAKGKKQKKNPKIKIQKYREIVPGGTGA